MKRSLIILTWLIAVVIAAPGTRGAERPNFVFVIADDLGWGDVGFHGGAAPTPHLDRLAEEGLELAQHYVAPVCSPTRAGFLTGRYWSRYGVTTPTNTQGLPFGTVTLASALGESGYETCLVGKWHLGSKPEWGPNEFGFDHSYGSLAGGVTSWTHRYKEGPYSVTWHRNGDLIEEEGHVTDLLTDEVVNWIRERGDAPFFLYVPYTAVHLPINEPEEWLERVPAEIESEIERQYAACVMHLDDAVGRILRALEEKGVREDTLFVFTSDNGGSTATNNTQPYPPDDSPPGALPGSNGELRGEKGSIYEGGTRVPTVVSWPGKIAGGEEGTPVCVVDWMPTFCGLAGYEGGEGLQWDGVDLSGLLLRGEALGERSIYVAGTRWRAVSLREGDWKLVVSGEGDGRVVELFNLAEDPGEATDLSEGEVERVAGMLGRLEVVAEADRDSVVER
ncbi:MAG: sulfatase-like hydrolase/transferase [Verrucomicrobiota bacterium]